MSTLKVFQIEICIYLCIGGSAAAIYRYSDIYRDMKVYHDMI